jgi:hypothetical protein
VDILGVVSSIISGAATAISVMAWKAARRSATAAERQADEASRSVQTSQIVALHEAQTTAQDSLPRVAVHLEDSYQNPCVLTSYGSSDETTSRPTPETLDPVRTHRIEFLGKRFRGIIVNHDTRPIALIAERGLFVEGVTPLWKEPVSLPQAQSSVTWSLDPGQAALFEWFGSCTVIDWYELARMPAADAFRAHAGVHVPYTVIAVNRAGDEQWALPAMRVILEFDRLPVYLPLPGPGHDGSPDPELLLLGGDGRGVRCDVRFRHPRVPRAFADLLQRGS